MDLLRLQRNWDNLGRTDPLWAILSHPTTRGGNWDPEAFLRTGVDFVRWVALHLEGLGALPARGDALDFGCGQGRLTQALAGWFERPVGVDLAPSMIEGARAIDRTGGRARFLVNDRPDLRQFADASFDFVLTALVLQHMVPEYAAGYLREFVRVLRPGGFAFVQLPVEPLARRAVAAPPVAQLGGSAGLVARTSVHPVGGFIYAGEWRWHRVHLVNAGRSPWLARGLGAVAIAARWLRLNGAAVAPATQVPLPHDVSPQSAAEVLVAMQAPIYDGSLQLAFLPAIAAAWIESADNPAARSVVQIVPRAIELHPEDALVGCPPPPSPDAGRHLAGAERGGEQHIEVHGTAIQHVLEIVAAAGGRVVDVGEDDWAGPEWLSAHYLIHKPQ
ncbi:MAG: class I SAM-dependent methyltransferase [Planctomycetes bacterium]|nr:class I SAM-dependent methyltransferase [Planctomycetota bacterium]